MFAGASPFVQTAWLVRDLDTALDIWLSRGAGPFHVWRHFGLAADYRDQPVELELSIALGQFDGMQIELIVQHNDAPSAFHDSFPAGPPEGIGGVHHLAMLNDDFDKALRGCATLDFAPATSGNFNGTRFAHIDTRTAYGFMTELTEATPAMLEIYRKVAESARNWDGSDPIRAL